MRNKHDNQDQWDEQSPLGDQASFLNPDSAPSTPSMPDAVWANLERSLFAEQVTRETNGQTNVVSLDARRKSKRGWVMGSVAAGVALLSVGVVVQSVQSSNPAPVAAGNQVTQGSNGILPVKQILASGTDYQPTTLSTQVKNLVNGFKGMDELMKSPPATAMPRSAMADELGTPEGLAGCIHALAHDENAKALVVDMATFNGDAAGVIIIPLSITEATSTSPASVHVWIVGSHCSSTNPDVLLDFTLSLPRSRTVTEYLAP